VGSFALSFFIHIALAVFISVSIGAETEPLQFVQVELLSVNEAHQNLKPRAHVEPQKKVLNQTDSISQLNQPADSNTDQVSTTDKENLITNLHGLSGQGDHVLSYLVGLIYKNRIYPYECIRLKQQGQVAVSFYIDGNGEVSDVKLLESSGFKQLDGAAMRTLRSLKIDRKVSQIQKLLSRKYSFIFDFEITKSS
jgi:TonB family protein